MHCVNGSHGFFKLSGDSRASVLKWKWIMGFPHYNNGVPLKVTQGSECLTPCSLPFHSHPEPEPLTRVMSVPCHSHVWPRAAKIIRTQRCVYTAAHAHANKKTCKDKSPFPHTCTLRLSLSWVKGGAGREWDIVLTDHSSTSESSHTSKPPLTHTGWPSCLRLFNRNTCFFVGLCIQVCLSFENYTACLCLLKCVSFIKETWQKTATCYMVARVFHHFSMCRQWERAVVLVILKQERPHIFLYCRKKVH